MMNAVVLLAGTSNTYHDAGYTDPKWLVEIDGVPAIERILTGLSSLDRLSVRHTFVLNGVESRRFHIQSVIKLFTPESAIIETVGNTHGAACSALLAVEQIAEDEELLIVNGDQIIDYDLGAVIEEFRAKRLDGGILVFHAVHPRWSYVKCEPDGTVVEVAEKRPISNLATAGFYWFKRGGDFVAGAKSMILKDGHTENMFYVCPVYNELILLNRTLGVHHIPVDAYHSLMTPALLKRYEEKLMLSKRG